MRMNKREEGRRFEDLEEKVYKEYLKKGYSEHVAREWAKATAGKVFWEKNGKHAGEMKIRKGRR